MVATRSMTERQEIENKDGGAIARPLTLWDTAVKADESHRSYACSNTKNGT